MRKKFTGFVAIVVVLTAIALVYITGHSNGPNAGASTGSGVATTTTTKPGTTFAAFYLDMGASASLGMQPTGIQGHNGRRTNTGYANDLLYLENLKHVSLTLRQMGCPGETVQSIFDTVEINHCDNAPNTQLTDARTFLENNQNVAGVVTIDLGFNDLRVCMANGEVNEACVNTAVAAAAADMPHLMTDLKSWAGPHVRLIGLEYNDPFLAFYLRGANGPAEATASLVAFDRMNAALGAAYTKGGAQIADVPDYFKTDDTTRVDMPNVGEIPQNVESACELTWECDPAPFGPDDHPNDAGYALIAQAIAAELPTSW